MYTDFFENIYHFFLQIYDSFTMKPNKIPIHKYEGCDDEKYLFYNQADDLIYLEESLER
jgi:hypothetical protein